MMHDNKRQHRIIGMMSGTSLDGVDLTFCVYYFNNHWKYRLLASKTYPYTPEIINSISVMQNPETNFLNFKKEELRYTQFICQLIKTFIAEHSLNNVEHICLHGHTIYHHPKQRITVQVANLPLVAASTGIDVIGNFRELDVMRGGEGAPLAPFGEELFDGDVFINLGGVANVGCGVHGWDINYCNLFFNYYAYLIDKGPHDDRGSIGRRGQLTDEVYLYLEQKWMKTKKGSLQRQQFQFLLHELQQKFKQIAPVDIVTTFYHFLASEIVRSITEIVHIANLKPKDRKTVEVMFSGGGAKNQFLIDLIKEKNNDETLTLNVAAQQILEFKQAIIFGFLGVKFLEGITNCSTGIGGTLAKGNKFP